MKEKPGVMSVMGTCYVTVQVYGGELDGSPGFLRMRRRKRYKCSCGRRIIPSMGISTC